MDRNDYKLDAPKLLRDFLVYHETIQGHSKKTADEYYLDLRNFFRYIKLERGLAPRTTELDQITIDDLDLDLARSVTLSDVYSYMSYLSRDRVKHANSPSSGFGLEPSARARKIAAIRSFYKYLSSKAKLMTENPMQDLDAPRLKKSLPRYLSLDESIQLLESVDEPNRARDYCILTLFLNCGLRISELVGLNLTDVREEQLRVLGKGNKERMLFLNAACRAALDDWLAERSQSAAVDRNALFLTRRHTRMTTDAVHYMVKQRLKKAGLDGLSLLQPQAPPYSGHADAPKRRGRAHLTGGFGPRKPEYHPNIYPRRQRRTADSGQRHPPFQGPAQKAGPNSSGQRRHGRGRAVRRISPQNVEISELLYKIGAQRPPVGIVAVGGHQGIFQGGRISHLHHNGRVAEGRPAKTELDKIPRFDPLQGGLHPEGTRTLLLAGDEVIKVRNSRPCRGLPIGVDVIPAEGGREVHHPGTGIEALGGKIWYNLPLNFRNHNRPDFGCMPSGGRTGARPPDRMGAQAGSWYFTLSRRCTILCARRFQGHSKGEHGSMMCYDAVIFDLDGTLLDTLGDLAASTNRALSHFGLPRRSLEEVRQFVGNGVEKLIRRAVPAGTDERLILDCLDWFKGDYLEHMEDQTAPYPGILALLEHCATTAVKQQWYPINLTAR